MPLLFETKPLYLGDAVYAQVTGGALILTTTSHNTNDADNIIHLEDFVIQSLIAYLKQTNAHLLQ